MKVGIITITSGYNYGNRLQNYAVQRIIENLGHEAETLHNNERVPTVEDKAKDFIKSCLVGTRYFNQVKRISNFKKFNEEYIKMSKLYISNSNIPRNIEKFDFFVCGSDQIWNPMFEENGKVNFLDFAPREKRIAFSPSFGTEFVPESRKDEFTGYINGIPHLSVREIAGAGIIKELTGRDAEVLLDPTLILTDKEWMLLSKPTSLKPKRRYILTYFLGELSSDYRRYIHEIAKENNLDILNINDFNSKIYTICPSQFIYLVSNASLVCTDSFHGMVFSLIMEVPFIVFDRQDENISMKSRFTSLLSKLSLESRNVDKIDNKNIFHLNFSEVKSILNIEREKSYGFIKNALGSNNQG